MRKAARIVFLFFLGLLSTVFLGVAMALMSAVSLAATALIVPGTGTPNANVVTNYREHARDYYMQGTACTNNTNCAPNNTGDPANGGLFGVDYPASFWPIPFNNWCPGLTCDTWNESEGEGVTALDGRLRTLLATTPESEQIVVFGYSQGGRVVGLEKMALANLTAAQKARIRIVTIGDIGTPNGGLWPRLGFLGTIPIWNVTFGLPTPTDIGIVSENYAFEYDLVGDSPNFWGNPFALLNSIAALEYVHGNYLTPNGNGPRDPIAYGYTPEELQAAIDNPANRQTFGDTTYVLIPAKGTLPLLQPIVDLAARTGLTPIVKPFISLFNPILKELVNLGYDRSINRGIPTLASPLPFNPFQNWVEVGIRLVVAAVQGVQAFLADLGVGATLAPSPAPAPMSTLALAAPVGTSEEATPGTESLSASEEQSTPEPTLRLVQAEDSEAAMQELDTIVEDETSTGDTSTEAEDETTPSAVDEPAAAKPEDEETDLSETTTPGSTVGDDQKAADDKKPADDAKQTADDAKQTADDAKKTADDDSKDADDAKKTEDSNDADDQKAAA